MLRDAAATLAAAGCDSPRLDAELLLAETLGTDRTGVVMRARDPLTAGAGERFAVLLARRAAREPVAYILGRRGFRHIELHCDRRALIPRPETELLVEAGLEAPHGARVLDVGTGTGAVALALAAERPDLSVMGTDSSAAALALARENAASIGLPVEFVEGDLRAGFHCDVLVANLPYVEADAVLPPEITEYEPAAALFAGPDGLDAIRRLCRELEGVSRVALEHGSAQGEAVAALLREAGFTAARTRRDLAGLDRVTVGARA